MQSVFYCWFFRPIDIPMMSQKLQMVELMPHDIPDDLSRLMDWLKGKSTGNHGYYH